MDELKKTHVGCVTLHITFYLRPSTLAERNTDTLLAEGLSDVPLPGGFADMTLAEGFADRYGQHEGLG